MSKRKFSSNSSEVLAKVLGKGRVILLSHKLSDRGVRLRQSVFEKYHQSRIRLRVLPHADNNGVGHPHVVVQRAQLLLGEVRLGINT